MCDACKSTGPAFLYTDGNVREVNRSARVKSRHTREGEDFKNVRLRGPAHMPQLYALLRFILVYQSRK